MTPEKCLDEAVREMTELRISAAYGDRVAALLVARIDRASEQAAQFVWGSPTGSGLSQLLDPM